MTWRDDLDALQFVAKNHGNCLVHRRAFRALLQKPPLQRDCEAFFQEHREAFEAAASAKIDAKTIADGVNFHLNSRQIRASLEEMGAGSRSQFVE
ncbi:hypothetical protein SAMN07250955_10374 [Arboricoccus pini]|uniref:Uncharacterized protein n=1 Tax=Arboricoccus pini TaxID=1963835 RepID=A0A212QRL6_9PROT|nr:DUF1488 family protein [Arboricoccus pini]SNB62247.1 hypothetical protein SAMN07250955_10374 [Arboricoccus pini]